jgi:hypothetical protein
MLARLRERSGGEAVRTHLGDMVDDLPAGPYCVVFAAFNTFFNLLDESHQQRCFSAVGARLAAGGWFMIEAFVPEPRSGSSVEVRSMSVDHVVLSVSRYDAGTQSAQGQYVSIDARGVRLRPWAIRYATPEQLDAMAADAGFAVAERWEDARRSPFAVDSPRHVTLYRAKPRSVTSAMGSTS